MISQVRTGVLVAVVVVAALSAGCGTEPAGTATSRSSTASSPAASSSVPASSAPAAAPAPAAATVRLSYANGVASGATGRAPVPLGSTVSLVVSGDTADEVHLHGYDRYLDVPAGGAPATLTFTADIPGVFEVELHDSGLLLTQLEVS